MAVFWVVAPCSLIEVYQHFRGSCCLHHQGDRPVDWGSKHLWNVSKLPPDSRAQQPRRQSSLYSPPWEPEISRLLWSSPSTSDNFFDTRVFRAAYSAGTSVPEIATIFNQSRQSLGRWKFGSTRDSTRRACWLQTQSMLAVFHGLTSAACYLRVGQYISLIYSYLIDWLIHWLQTHNLHAAESLLRSW
jgi:hypothetical protein